MDTQQQYAATVARLQRCGYQVTADARGYVVQHQTDRTDRSRARVLADLMDFADLIEWAAQRQDDARHARADEGMPRQQ